MTQVPVITKTNVHHTMEALRILAPIIEAKANEIALAKQAQDQFISADEARKRGAGNAEWRDTIGEWYKCNIFYWQSNLDRYDNVNTKYRAIRKEVPAEPTFAGLKKVSTEKLPPEFEKILHDNLWELYETDKPSEPKICTIKNLDTNIISTMTQEAAQKLQAETKDVCDWFFPDGGQSSGKAVFAFDDKTGRCYTYKLKAKKPVSWLDMPVGVMTNHGLLMGIDEDGQACLYVASDIHSVYIGIEDLKLAPADQQPCLNWRGGDCPVPEGVVVEVTLRNKVVLNNQDASLSWEYDDRKVSVEREIISYRVTGIAEGWELK